MIPSPLFSYTSGQKEIEGTGDSLAQLMASLDARYPGMRHRMIDEQNRIRLSKSGAEEAAERKEAADYMKASAPKGGGKGFGTLGDLMRQKLERK